MSEKKKYICVVKGQKRLDDGAIMFFEPGDPGFFEKPPGRLFKEASIMGSGVIDFSKIPEKLLLQEDIVPVEEMSKFIKNTYDVDMFGALRRDLVSYIISHRGLDTSSLSDTGSAPVTAANFKNKSFSDDGGGIGVTFSDDDEELKTAESELSELNDSEEEDELSDLLKG